MNKYLIIFLTVLVGCKKPTNTALNEKQENSLQKKYISKLTTPSLNKLIVIEDALHFMVIGDWGRQGYYNQAELGAMMQQISMVVEPEFIISTGDNFYPSGVASTQDPIWKNSFEDIYTGNYLHAPWYISLGNHDYKGNIDAQIEYSNISRRWTLPSRYWFKDFEMEDEPIGARFTFMDTSPLQDDYYSDIDYKDKVKNNDTIAQLKWIDKTLGETPKNFWNIAIGHHPLYTGGKRKNKTSYSRLHLEKYLEKHKVNAYLCGHEHDLQHIKPSDKFTHHFISGAGSKKRETGEIDGTHTSHSDTGVMLFSLTKEELLVQIINFKGNVLYQKTIQK